MKFCKMTDLDYLNNLCDHLSLIVFKIKAQILKICKKWIFFRGNNSAKSYLIGLKFCNYVELEYLNYFSFQSDYLSLFVFKIKAQMLKICKKWIFQGQ